MLEFEYLVVYPKDTTVHALKYFSVSQPIHVQFEPLYADISISLALCIDPIRDLLNSAPIFY